MADVRAVVVSLRIIVVGGCMIGGGLMGLCMVLIIRSLMKPTMLCGISLQPDCETEHKYSCSWLRRYTCINRLQSDKLTISSPLDTTYLIVILLPQ